MRLRGRALFLAVWLAGGCTPETQVQTPTAAPEPPALLLITLDTTRADSLGFESDAVQTPHLDALAAAGTRFAHAYTTAPTTLPAHASMLTGLYPADHGVHENARRLGSDNNLVAERLQELGYTTAAFISGLPLASQFGLARGFDHYDDAVDDATAERRADETTDRALEYLDQQRGSPLFLWVHYFDPHEPYAPPEPFASEYAGDPYLGEIAFMDREIGRLLSAFRERTAAGPHNILVVGDHGEGRGDHGEERHGNLLYQGVVRVPMIAAGSGVQGGTIVTAVSVRRVFDTLLHWAGEDRSLHLLSGETETVLAEALKPFRQYGWQPQIMAVRDGVKIIQSGEIEVYDLTADAAETDNLAGRREIGGEVRQALRSYPIAPAGGPTAGEISARDRERLASLGYVDWEGQTTPRPDAPSPKAMTHLFADLDRGSGLFIAERYGEAIPVFERVLEQDSGNLMVAVRLAVAHSVSGNGPEALRYFERARQIDPSSLDARHYLAMHHFRSGNWGDAEPLFASVLAQMPDRLPALESLAAIRERQGDLDAAIPLLQRIADLPRPPIGSLLKLGELSMARGETVAAIEAFERVQVRTRDSFSHSLELGVLYLADRRFAEAAESLEQVPSSHPGYAMALFKRAQASVLLAEPDRVERVRLAYRHRDAMTQQLIENEALFRDLSWR